MDFKLTSEYKPTGDQPEAIAELVAGVNHFSSDFVGCDGVRKNLHYGQRNPASEAPHPHPFP